MEGSGSPRFRKLHFPVGLWINSPRKHFAKLGGRWPSAISVKSTTSSDAASLHESRTKRLSHLFLRGRSNSDRDRAVGERERELWAHSAAPSSHHYLPPASSSAPGLIKIYGDALSSGANYRSLLANSNSTARQLIAQFSRNTAQRTSCCVMSLESPSSSQMELSNGRQRAGEALPRVRWRGRKSSGGGPEESERGHRARNSELRRSISDMNLSLRRRQGNHVGNDPRGNRPNNNGGVQDRKNIVSMIHPLQGEIRASKAEAKVGWTNQSAEDEKDYSSCDLEVMSQSLILPPTDRPYFLLLQGYDQSKVDTFLSAPDILARHLLVRRDSAVPESSTRQALMRPFRGGAVTHNGVALYRETVLKPGDVIGLGNHFLFLYRDPRVSPAPPLALTLPWQADGSTTCCPSGLVDRQEALRQYLGSTEAVLKFHPRHTDALLQEIISNNSSPDSGGGPLAPAYLLSIMIDHASKHLDPALTPQILLKSANLIKEIVWDNIKEFGDKHPTQNSTEQEGEISTPNVQKLSSDLRPLMFWMSNATELLNFFQVKVETMEKEWEFEAPGDPVLTADMDTCSEALAQLDDVIMHTFQQCVYHLTKTLYSLLPEACLSPPLTSQTFGYLFFFTNTSLLNTLLERDGLFSWSRAVQIRTNLDLVLDWLQGAGLGDIASEFMKKLSVTVNFLCIPKTRLIQSSWTSLQEDHVLLSPSQLHHLLTHYKLGPTRAPPASWAPLPGTELSGDIFESFLDHPPLILPNETPRLDLSQPIPSPELHKEVTRLRTFLWGLDQDELPANQRTRL
ncbi:hypothetical protein JOQ06_025432 [Pogonophryne albipinna]|uniref:Dilute domain-containing protein n=1 Tax=Pogonophryne albipinna TaxID=1090488 RepID=A0AAD6FEP8_9TELE|nr:hypothetical protein JOQ06_025432 [Pogonophryne albipinna]